MLKKAFDLFALTALIAAMIMAPALTPQARAVESRFGFVGNVGVVGGDPANYWLPFAELRFGWDRPHIGPFNWNDIEPVTGAYVWTEVDAYVLAAQANGVNIIATIWPFTEWDQVWWRAQPGWEASAGFQDELPDSRYPPHDYAAYQAFVGALVERFDGDGLDDMPGLTNPIKHWEVANEPETANWPDLSFFKGDQNDYLGLLMNTNLAIKSADPEAVVVQGGATGADNDWWVTLFDLGGAANFSQGNLHAITPTQEDFGSTAWAALMGAYNISSWWLTEVQLASGDAASGNLTELEQAEAIIKGYVESFARGAEKIFWTVYQVGPDEADPTFVGAALIDQNGNKKKAWYAFETMTRLIDSFTTAQQIDVGQFKFITDDGDYYVFWGSGGLPAYITGQVKVWTCDGQFYQVWSEEVTLSDQPIFVHPTGLERP